MKRIIEKMKLKSEHFFTKLMYDDSFLKNNKGNATFDNLVVIIMFVIIAVLVFTALKKAGVDIVGIIKTKLEGIFNGIDSSSGNLTS